MKIAQLLFASHKVIKKSKVELGNEYRNLRYFTIESFRFQFHFFCSNLNYIVSAIITFVQKTTSLSISIRVRIEDNEQKP